MVKLTPYQVLRNMDDAKNSLDPKGSGFGDKSEELDDPASSSSSESECSSGGDSSMSDSGML